MTLFMQAVMDGDLDITQLLIDRGANLDIQQEVSLNVGLLLSSSYSCIFKLMILLCPQHGDTALMLAFAMQNLEMSQLLIYKGANLNIQNKVS